MRARLPLWVLAMALPVSAEAQSLDPVNAGCYTRNVPFVSRMTFTVRTAGRMRILIASGTFDTEASARFKAFMPGAGQIDEVWFDSPGGIATEGIALGAAIRAAGLPTRVPTGMSCISACTMAFLGGPFRSLDTYSNYGIHAAFSQGFLTRFAKGDADESQVDKFNEAHKHEVDLQQLGAQMQSYAARMGVSSKFIANVMLGQKSVVAKADGTVSGMYRCLSLQEAQSYNVVNQ